MFNSKLFEINAFTEGVDKTLELKKTNSENIKKWKFRPTSACTAPAHCIVERNTAH